MGANGVDVDVVVVGAGPAGLACAYMLAGKRVLLLEREARHGGRIQTIDLAQQRVDMGACFAFDPVIIPSGLAVDAGRLVEERGVLSLCSGGQTWSSETPRGCLVRMGVDAATLEKVDSVARLSRDAASMRGSHAYELLDALTHQVHPAELADYDRRHQRDGLLTWYPDHWESGNGVLTDTLLAASGADIELSAEVTRVIEGRERVEVEYQCAGASRRIIGRAAVIATTADVAASLVDWREPRLRHFLATTRYAGFLVVALAGPVSSGLREFRSMVPLSGTPALVVQQRNHDRDRAVLLSFFRGDAFAQLASRGDEELVTATRAALGALGVDAAALDALGESAVRRWGRGGTILSSNYLDARTAIVSLGSNAIVLAGDYTTGAEDAGYGVAPAVRSGIRAARRVEALLAC